jgi:transposase-like protein
VPAKAVRRRFSAEYKLRILEQADRCDGQGQIGLLLRREGLRSSHLANWRKARREGSLARLSRKRGRKPKVSAEQRRIQQLERENQRLHKELETAKTILEVQGKVARLLGLNPSDGESSS